jgi:Holliday junction DNA helicase RuvB
MELIGHENEKNQLKTAARAAAVRNTSLPHMLFAGAPGCGKTSMARYVAKKSGLPFLSIVPNTLSDYGGVLKVLDQLNHKNYDEYGNRTGTIRPTILFLDEIHNTPLKGQELLGLAMERFIIESGKPNKFFWVPQFTLIGATTSAGKLSKPFLDRFKLNFTFQPYEVESMCKIVKLHAKNYGISIVPTAVLSIAKRSRGTPRIAVGFVERVRDRMLSINSVIGTKCLVDSVFREMGIDEGGLTSVDMRVLRCLYDANAPVGIDNLSIVTEEDRKTIRDKIEPFLIKKGLIVISGKGRSLTEKGIEYVERVGKVDKPIKKEIDWEYKRN